MGTRWVRGVVAAVVAIGGVGAAPHDGPDEGGGASLTVAVLSVPSMVAPGAPAGFDEEWVTSVLTNHGWDVVVTDGASLAPGTDVVVNLHGAAYPASAAVEG